MTGAQGPRAAQYAGSSNEDDFELDDEIDRLSMMLSTTEIKSMDWADTMICAPRAIGILGECLLLSSHRRAALIQHSDQRLRATSLPANLRQCAITGKITFDEAASRMRNISAQALILSRDGAGIIDRITKFACKTQTPAVARELEKQKTALKTVAARCTEDADALQVAFKNWNDETTTLLQALNIGEDQIVQKADTVATDLVNTEMLLERLKKQLGFDGMNLQEIEERLLEREVAAAGTAVIGTPVVAAGLLLQLLGASIGGPMVLGASLAIWGRAIFAGCTQIKRDMRLHELQEKALKAQTLDQQLQRLSSASCTVEEMRKIVGDAVRQILDLQFQVSTLLGFFKAVFKKVESLDRDQAQRLEEHIDDEGYQSDH